MTVDRGLKRLCALIGRFRLSRGGNMAVTFAFAAMPGIGATGAAVALSTAGGVKTRSHNWLDAGVLPGVTQARANQISTANTVFSGDFAGKFGTTATASFV